MRTFTPTQTAMQSREVFLTIAAVQSQVNHNNWFDRAKTTPLTRLVLRLELEEATRKTRHDYYMKIATYAAKHVKRWGRHAARRYCELRLVPIAYYCKARHDYAKSVASWESMEAILSDGQSIPSVLQHQFTSFNED